MDKKEKANICLQCTKSECDGDAKCFNERKRLLKLERTPRNTTFKCRETVETGDKQVEAVETQ